MKRNRACALYYSMLQYQPENRARLAETFDLIELADPTEDTPDLLSRVEVLFAPLGFMVDKAKIDACPKLCVIASNTTGHPHIDVDYARTRGVAVACLKFAPAFLESITPTAELTMGLIVALTRNMVPAHKAVLDGRWDRRPFGAPAMLSRMSLGIIGLGRLGRRVARYAAAMDMTVRYCDPFVKSFDGAAERVSTPEELVALSDVVTLHVPHEKATEKMIDAALLRRFRKGSYFINTARGELVDWDALLAALRSGHLAGAALDVFEGEFEPGFAARFKDHPLLDHARQGGNVILTPHIGGSTVDAWRETEAHTIDMVIEALRGKEAGI